MITENDPNFDSLDIDTNLHKTSFKGSGAHSCKAGLELI